MDMYLANASKGKQKQQLKLVRKWHCVVIKESKFGRENGFIIYSHSLAFLKFQVSFVQTGYTYLTVGGVGNAVDQQLLIPINQHSI